MTSEQGGAIANRQGNILEQQVRQAFGRVLLREDEMVKAMSCIGADDGLGDWFGS